MIGSGPNPHQSVLFNDLRVLLNPQHHLCRLADLIPWSQLEERFAPLYASVGRPSKPIRLMAGLLMLKHLCNVSDEVVVEQWRQNPYWQYFTGMTQFMWDLPCDPTELVKFRQRIGAEGAEAILALTITMHGKAADPTTIIVDTTAQEKAITVPRERKLYRRVAERILALAAAEGVRLRRTYRRTIPKLMRKMITGNFPRAVKRARRCERTLRRIAARLLRDFSGKISADRRFELGDELELYHRILTQDPRKGGPEKIYSVHEPQVYAIARGKDRGMFEFGTKVSLAISARSGVIVGAMNLATNRYDGDTLPEAVEQVEALTGRPVDLAIADKGYRGPGALRAAPTRLIHPALLAAKHLTPTRRRWLKRWIRRRSAIEPIIGHLKSDHRLGRNFLKGWLGDEMNVLLAAAAWNLRILLRKFLWLLAQIALGIGRIGPAARQLEPFRGLAAA